MTLPSRILVALVGLFLPVSIIGCASFKKIAGIHATKTFVGSTKENVINEFGTPLEIRPTSDGSEILYFKDRWYLVKEAEVIDGDLFGGRKFAISVVSHFDNSEKKSLAGLTFEIYSGSRDIPNNDLAFKMYAKGLASALISAEMRRSNLRPDLIILMNLGISEPTVEVETVSHPVFTWVPGVSSQYSGIGPGGAYRGNVTSTGYTQYLGSSTEVKTKTNFKRFLQLLVYESKTMKDKEPKMVSKVLFESIGPDDDLKPVVGAMFYFVDEYIAMNSKGKERKVLSSNDAATRVFFEH